MHIPFVPEDYFWIFDLQIKYGKDLCSEVLAKKKKKSFFLNNFSIHEKEELIIAIMVISYSRVLYSS